MGTINTMSLDSLDLLWVTDHRVRKLLEDYWSQGLKAFEAESYLGALVSFGSVLEGLLTWALLQHKDKALRSTKACKKKSGDVKPLEKWNLSNLINVAIDLDLIGKVAKEASWGVKDFRNLIHPYRLLQQSARPDIALAMSAYSAVLEISRSLKGRISK